MQLGQILNGIDVVVRGGEIQRATPGFAVRRSQRCRRPPSGREAGPAFAGLAPGPPFDRGKRRPLRLGRAGHTRSGRRRFCLHRLKQACLPLRSPEFVGQAVGECPPASNILKGAEARGILTCLPPLVALPPIRFMATAKPHRVFARKGAKGLMPPVQKRTCRCSRTLSTCVERQGCGRQLQYQAVAQGRGPAGARRRAGRL